MEVSIETTTGKPQVDLILPLDVQTSSNGVIHFSSMEDLAAFSDSVAGLANGWRADEKFAALTGIRKLVRDAIVEQMRGLIRLEHDDVKADSFPEDTLFGGQFHIDVQKLHDSDFLKVTVEQHVKAMVVMLAEAIAAGRTITS